MKTADLLPQIDRLEARAATIPNDHAGGIGIYAEVLDFTRKYCGEKSAFAKAIVDTEGSIPTAVSRTLVAVLQSIREHVKNGLLTALSIERQAEIDTVSELLGQAQELLNDEKVHPACGAFLIGACLEEFLREWVNESGLSIGNDRPGIEAYANALHHADLISVQDRKNITSWGGYRKAAAHAEWDDVSDRTLIRLMLEGVNVFIAKYSDPASLPLPDRRRARDQSV
jgi:hypothetical protein